MTLQFQLYVNKFEFKANYEQEATRLQKKLRKTINEIDDIKCARLNLQSTFVYNSSSYIFMLVSLCVKRKQNNVSIKLSALSRIV